MSYTFKGTCIKNEQSSTGSHVATIEGPAGERASIPSVEMLCEVGEAYSVTLDGKFAAKPALAKAPAPAPVAAKPVAPAPTQPADAKFKTA